MTKPSRLQREPFSFSFEVEELLTEDEWTTVHPIARLNEMLMQHCRGKEERIVVVKSGPGEIKFSFGLTAEWFAVQNNYCS